VRLYVLLLSSLLLGACTNMVRSEAPWFGPADAAGAPALRDGVWTAMQPDCRFDPARPLEQWPACAQGRVIRGGEALDLSSIQSEDGRGRRRVSDYSWSSEAFVLAAGTPRIHQSACGAPRSGKAPDEDPAAARTGDASPTIVVERPAEVSAIDEAVSRLVYCYAGLRAEAFDAEGRIVAFTTWPIWCGPFPRGGEGEGGPSVTDSPFPGITVVGEHCVAEDIAALRAAATASETLDAPPDEPAHPLGLVRFRWIRDGWR
jgi:hypothetical protein